MGGAVRGRRSGPRVPLQPEQPGATRRIVVPKRLAALTGRSVHALAGAMPELRDPAPNWEMFRHQPQTGCHLCDARHPGGRVVRLLPHHAYVCLWHGTWIGPPDIDRPAVGLARLPDIIDAQRRHLLLLRRYGWAATYDAVLTGFMFCAHIWSSDGHPSQGPGVCLDRPDLGWLIMLACPGSR